MASACRRLINIVGLCGTTSYGYIYNVYGRFIITQRLYIVCPNPISNDHALLRPAQRHHPLGGLISRLSITSP